MRMSIVAVAAATAARAVDLTNIASFLQNSSASVWPALKDIADEIYHDPEVGRDEHHAHNRVVKHFSTLGSWVVTPHAYGLETAFELIFENRPAGSSSSIPTIGFLAEYDALVGIGHACGHNHIVLNGIAAATMTAQTLVAYGIPGRVRVVGCPDEENAAGKFRLNQRGAFDGADIWMMAHPTATSAVQPMNARLNLFPRFSGNTHTEAVGKAYKAMVLVRALAGTLPGTSSSATLVENVGVYATNVVQSQIGFGVLGTTKESVEQAVARVFDNTYPGVSYTVFEDSIAGGVSINITGPGGHASENTKGPLTLSIETFRALSGDGSLSFYLPGNMTTKKLDITVDLRTRYTMDLPILAEAVSKSIEHLADADISSDLKYPALELVPSLPETFLSLIKSPAYGLDNFIITNFAPASTDASWVENPVLDPDTKELVSVGKVVFHPNYSICDPSSPLPCGFNHEPVFARTSGTEFAYAQTEIIARAEAHMAVELLADADKMREATEIVKK
ncbi:Peptidase M20 domain-containing protein [Paramyrothecium foliicola]|nr:Peptidase M20 domain-containing protein [Paramyrothecium foliicola]